MLKRMMRHDDVEGTIHRAEITFEQAETGSIGFSLLCHERIYASEITKIDVAQLLEKDATATANIQHRVIRSTAESKEPFSIFRRSPKAAEGRAGQIDRA